MGGMIVKWGGGRYLFMDHGHGMKSFNYLMDHTLYQVF